MLSEESQNGWWQDLYQELKDRRVIRVATLYVVLFWPVIQIADILSPALDIPPDGMRYLLVIFALGLPIVLILSWLYDLNRSGVVRGHAKASDERKAGANQALLGRRFEHALIGVLLVVIMFLFYVQYADNSASPPKVSAPALQTIAVLPFVTLSEKQADQFFADGLTEELLNALSQLRSLRVIARTSSFAYKGVNRNVQEIGRELEVATILEGSVRRNDVNDTIRITAQLIDVASGTHLWSQSFNRQFRDVFQIQDEIAAAVVNQLQITLIGHEMSEIKARESANPEALVLFSMGSAELAKRTPQSLGDAVRFFDRAIQLDPGYVDAYAELGKAHALLYNNGDRQSDRLNLAQRAIDRALELDGDSANGWAVRGLLMWQNDDIPQARGALQRAMELNPNHAMAQMWYGQLIDDPSERFAFLERAYELDPRSAVAGYNVAEELFRVGRDAEAMDVFSRIVETDPYYPAAYLLVARINASKGRLASAIRNYERSYELEATGDTALQIANLYRDIGKYDLADAWIASARLLLDNNVPALMWARVSALAARGKREEAEAILRPMMSATQANAEAASNAALAAYFLEDSAATIASWERAREFRSSANVVGFRADDGSLPAAIAAAHAYAQIGATEKVSAMLDEIAQWVEQRLSTHGNVTSELWYVKAQMSAIQGDESVALLNLQRAIDEGWTQHWRATFEPCFRALVQSETFKSMMAGLGARMELMGEQMAFDEFFAALVMDGVKQTLA